jgi:hypothetical protein
MVPMQLPTPATQIFVYPTAPCIDVTLDWNKYGFLYFFCDNLLVAARCSVGTADKLRGVSSKRLIFLDICLFLVPSSSLLEADVMLIMGGDKQYKATALC